MKFIISDRSVVDRDTICVSIDNSKISSLENLDKFFANFQFKDRCDYGHREICSVICVDEKSNFFRAYTTLYVSNEFIYNYLMSREVLFEDTYPMFYYRLSNGYIFCREEAEQVLEYYLVKYEKEKIEVSLEKRENYEGDFVDRVIDREEYLKRMSEENEVL